MSEPEYCAYCGYQAYSEGTHDGLCVGYLHGFSWTKVRPQMTERDIAGLVGRALGYAGSLEQQARWVREALEPDHCVRAKGHGTFDLGDVDTDELDDAAAQLRQAAAALTALQQEREQIEARVWEEAAKVAGEMCNARFLVDPLTSPAVHVEGILRSRASQPAALVELREAEMVVIEAARRTVSGHGTWSSSGRIKDCTCGLCLALSRRTKALAALNEQKEGN